MSVSLWVIVPTLLCSAISFVASTLFGLIYLYFPPHKHYRQMLVCNLLVAGWINSLNNTVSGAFALHSSVTGHSDLSPGPSCEANAWIGQFSVQAIDFSVLAIAMSVLLILSSDTICLNPSTQTVFLICLSTWVPSIITSNVALGLGVYGPVSGNWCWIKSNSLGIRYALTHGWRVFVFLAIIAIYIWVYTRLQSVFNHPPSSAHIHDYFHEDSHEEKHTIQRAETEPQGADTEQILPAKTESTVLDSASIRTKSSARSIVEAFQTYSPRLPGDLGKDIPSGIPVAEHVQRHSDNRPDLAYSRRRIMLISGYPIVYVILWLPGMANRLAEAIDTTPTWLTALQATTQLVPLANALTYAHSERLSSRVSTAWHRRKQTSGPGWFRAGSGA